MKKSVKNLLPILLLVFLTVALAAGALVACTPPNVYEIVFSDDVDMSKLEFVSGEFNRTKPTLFYFHGVTTSAERVTLLRPMEYDDVMDKNESSKPLNIKGNLADYWKEQGWNVAIFHCETEAKDGEAKFYEKMFQRNTGILNQFINIYRIHYKSLAAAFDGNVNQGVAQSIPEIRFAGEGVGASFAAYAAESIATLVQDNKLSQYYLPWRLTLLNPNLDNAPHGTSAINGGAGSSPLAGVNRAVGNACRVGNTVAELVESDMNYAASYASPYSEADNAIYSEILQKVAALEINETFSTTANWTPALKETIARVWYLASVGGSDYDSTSGSSAPSTMKNLLPFINNPKENYSNTTSFSLSAWTPTSATRVLRGLRFRSADYNSSETPKYKERLVTKFRLELFESSFLTQTTPRIGGYLFIDQNGDIYMNDGRKSVMHAGIVVTMRYTISGSEETSVTAMTDTDGFYMFDVPADAYNVAVYLNFDIPDYRFVFSGKDNGGKTYDEQCSMAVFSGSSQYVSSTWREQYNIIKNCGYRYADLESK